jgi:hypothetical protein
VKKLLELLRWSVDEFWPIMVVGMVVACVSGWFVVARADERQTASFQVRQAAADAWIKRQGLEATATCFGGHNVCDVVPKDPRAPFEIMCWASGECALHR